MAGDGGTGDRGTGGRGTTGHGTTAARGTGRTAAASKGVSGRGIESRGTPDAGLPQQSDAGTPGAAQAVASGKPIVGVFVFQTAQGKEGESGFCPESEGGSGPWQKRQLVGGVADVGKAVSAAAAGGAVSRLGIMAHGNEGGVLYIGPDKLSPSSLASFRPVFAALDRDLAPGAEVDIFGCVSGEGEQGTQFLVEMSKLLPGRDIVGFNSITVQVSKGARAGGRCVDPNPFITGTLVQEGQSERFLAFKDSAVVTAWQKQYHNDPALQPATRDARSAKVCRDGKVLRWPDDEEKTHPGVGAPKKPASSKQAPPAKKQPKPK